MIVGPPRTPPRAKREASVEAVDDGLLGLPEDLIWCAVGELLGDLPYSPGLAVLARTCRRFAGRHWVGESVARSAAAAARAALDRRCVLVVAHTRECRGRGRFADLGQNFAMCVTPSTPLSAVYAAMDKRLRVSARAVTQCKRPRPCGQTIAVGYTYARGSRVVLVARSTGAPLATDGDCAALCAAAAPLPALDPARGWRGARSRPGAIAAQVDLHLERDPHITEPWDSESYEESSDSEGDDDAPLGHEAATPAPDEPADR